MYISNIQTAVKDLGDQRYTRCAHVTCDVAVSSNLNVNGQLAKSLTIRLLKCGTIQL